MILQKQNSKSPPTLQFHIGSKKIDITKEYMYLPRPQTKKQW